jgi:hypothetical protein
MDTIIAATSSCEVRAVIRFLHAEGQSAAEILRPFVVYMVLMLWMRVVWENVAGNSGMGALNPPYTFPQFFFKPILIISYLFPGCRMGLHPPSRFPIKCATHFSYFLRVLHVLPILICMVCLLSLYRHRWLLIFKKWTRKSEMVIESKRHVCWISKATCNFAVNI